MKIAPSQESSPIPADQAGRIQSWETELGTQLPADYRAFLLRFNGGFPYPNLFDEVTPEAGRRGPDTLVICDRLYDLDYAMGLGKGAIYGDAVPPDVVFFGQDPGGMEFLISLREPDFGAVLLWLGTTSRWGTDGNDEGRLFKQADSFHAFLAHLYDTEDKLGYRHWATPAAVQNAVEMNLD